MSVLVLSYLITLSSCRVVAASPYIIIVLSSYHVTVSCYPRRIALSHDRQREGKKKEQEKQIDTYASLHVARFPFLLGQVPSDDGKRFEAMDVVWGIRRIYSIAREGVWGREGLAVAVHRGLADFSWSVFSLFFALGWSWVALGLLLAFLVVLGAVLDRSWIGLGRSWVALGRLLGRFLLLLGRLQAVLGHLGAILVRLGVVSGRLGELKTLIFLRFFNDFCKIKVLSKNGDLDPS